MTDNFRKRLLNTEKITQKNDHIPLWSFLNDFNNIYIVKIGF